MSASTSTLDRLRTACGFAFIALRDAAVEALLIDEQVRAAFLAAAHRARTLFKTVLPDPAAAVHQPTVAVIRVLAERLADVARPPDADLSRVIDAVDALLDRCVGAQEYVIRAAAEGIEPDPLIDLSQIDFDVLAARLAGRKRTETDRLACLLKQRAIGAAHRNPTRYDLVERIEELIAEYNAGSLNIDQYPHRLIALSHDLSEQERRAVVEDLTEAAAGDLRPAHHAGTGARRRRPQDGEGQREAAARPPARQARPRLAPQGRRHRRGP